MPWRNGRGTTRELVAAPDGAWRVSVAHVPGPAAYSRFDGADRVSCVVAGDGLALVVDGAEVSARHGEVVAYPGEADTRAVPLGGAVQNLNLVLARGRVRGSMRVRDVDAGGIRDPDAVAVWVLAGELELRAGTVRPGHVWLPEPGGPAGPAGGVRGAARAVVVTATPARESVQQLDEEGRR
ncbi:HutD family protein [Nocardioides zeae]|uniref:HutD family protein n=1 Tax=Nocardioides imazamoxiresistens TaxID=3231893 RepID=A0ABU3PYN2_9ACTN|nr:HutD family protein [Nocardioides zeae]MDT9593991.1 HutD family protein [Nocardioides zeae]